MRIRAFGWLVGVILPVGVACAPAVNNNSVYENWGSQLEAGAAGGAVRTVDDVSLLIGTTPTRCDTVVGPTRGLGLVALGIGTASRTGYVNWVMPGSVADSDRVPLRVNIESVDGHKPVSMTTVDTTAAGIITTIAPSSVDAASVSVGVPVVLKFTDGQSITLTLRSADWFQCYWHAGAGQVSESSASYGARASAGIVEASGSASGGASSASYDKYFNVSARFINGVMTAVSSNWQGR